MPNTRRNRKSRGVVSTLYSPLHHAFVAGEEVASAITNTARNVVRTGIRGVDKVGRSVTGHADAAVRNVFSRKRRGGKRSGRKSRKASRKTRRHRRNRRN